MPTITPTCTRCRSVARAGSSRRSSAVVPAFVSATAVSRTARVASDCGPAHHHVAPASNASTRAIEQRSGAFSVRLHRANGSDTPRFELNGIRDTRTEPNHRHPRGGRDERADTGHVVAPSPPGSRREAGTRAAALVRECARPCEPSLQACYDVRSRGHTARALRLKTDVAGYSCTNAARRLR